MQSTAKQMTPFHYWISLWPQAPFFGVEWRFAKMFPGVTWFNPADTMAKVAAAGVVEAVKATEEATVALKHAQEEAAAAIVDLAAQAVHAVEPMAFAVEAEQPAAAEPVAPVAVAAEADVTPVPPAVLYDIAPVDADDLRQLRGVGPKLAEMLNAMGIYRFEQIASFSEANLAWVDQNLTSFKGRPMRDGWVEQARALR